MTADRDGAWHAKQAGHAAAKADEWTAERDRRIRIAHDEGAGNRTLARATGLSHTAIAKILARRA